MTTPGHSIKPDFKGVTDEKHIGLFLSSLAGGGAERVFLSLAEAFARCGHRVDVVLSVLRGELVSEIPTSIRVIELGAADPITVLWTLIRLPLHTWSTVLPNMILRRRKKVRSLHRLEQYLLQQCPDVLLASTDIPNLLALWGGWLARTKTRVFVKADVNLTTWVEEAPDSLQRKLPRLIRAWYPRAHGIVAVSGGLADELAGLTGLPRDRINVIHNPVDCERIAKLASEDPEDPWFGPGQPPVVLAAGRLHPQKDYPTLLRAFAQLRREQKARLVILGEGSERPHLESLAGELGIAEDLRLMGFRPNPFAYMSRSAVFVLSSAWEGLSNVLIEALACGCPVVSTNCPHGPAEVLENGKHGRLVPVRDHEALAKAIQLTLQSEADPEKARIRARQFDIEIVAQRYLRLFSSEGQA